MQANSGRWGKLWRWIAATAAAGIVASCSAVGLKRPGDVGGRVLEDTLGGAPDLAVSSRLSRVMNDSLYGPIARCAIAHGAGASAAADLAAQSEAVDVWAKDDAPTLDAASLVVVARGVMGFAPAMYTLDDGRPEWAAGKPLKSGVTEYAPAASGHGTWLFVLPDRTYVLARGRAADHARAHFIGAATAPAPLEQDPNALAVAWSSGSFLVRHGADLGHEIEGVTTGNATVAPGPDGSIVVRLQADGDRRAVAIEQRLRDWGVRDVCPSCRALARFIHVERVGSILKVDVRTPASELDDLRLAACSAGRKPEHVATPLPTDFAQPAVLPPRVAFVNGKDIAAAWVPFEQKSTDPALLLATFDERGKLLKRLDAPGSTWRLHGENTLPLDLEHVLAGNRIVVHDTSYAKQDDEAILLYDAATGKRTTGMVIPARGRLCASSTEPLVFVEDDDPARQTLIHTDTGSFEKAPRPTWCPARPKTGPCAQPSRTAACIGAENAPKIPDFAPYYALVLGDDGVVLGERAEGGRHVAMAAGYDAAKGTVRWTRILPNASKDVADEGSPRIADIAYGALLVEFDEWHGKWKLAALDLKSGKTTWEAPLREPQYFGVSPTRVWLTDVEHRPGQKPELVTSVHALDLATGKPSP